MDDDWGRSRDIGVLDADGDHRMERGSFDFWGVNLGRPIVTNGNFATRLFPNYIGQDLFSLLCSRHGCKVLHSACLHTAYKKLQFFLSLASEFFKGPFTSPPLNYFRN